MPTFFLAGTANYLQKTLNGSISSTVTTITLNNTTSMPGTGYIIVDRINSSSVATPNSREVVSYTGISGNDLTGCTRGADGSTARSHNDAAIVEVTPTVGMWNNLATIVSTGFTSDGYLKAINSPVSIARAQITQMAVESVASIANLQITNLVYANATISNSLAVSGASLTGIPWIQTGTSEVNVGAAYSQVVLTNLNSSFPNNSYRVFLSPVSLITVAVLSSGSQSASAFFVRVAHTVDTATFPGGTIAGFHWMAVRGAG